MLQFLERPDESCYQKPLQAFTGQYCQNVQHYQQHLR